MVSRVSLFRPQSSRPLLRLLLSSTLSFALVPAAARASSLVTNGSFQTGDLSGWSVYTAGGSNGGGLPAVTSFDVTGTGATNAARFEAGTATVGTQGGGGLSQTITISTAGVYSFSEDWAATALNLNSDQGVFSLIVDGTTIASGGGGTILYNATDRGTISGDILLQPGSYSLQAQVTRKYGVSSGYTPYQYITGIDGELVSGLDPAPSVTPEPGSASLMLTGLVGVAAAVRRRMIRG